MVFNLKKIVNFSTLNRALKLLSREEKSRLIIVCVIQIFLALIDLLGVALIGLLGSLAITGISSKGPGNRVSWLLELLGIDSLTLQQQVALIGLISSGLLIGKTLFSIVITRKTTLYLSLRSASISSKLLKKVLAQPLLGVQSRSMQETLYAVTTGVDVVMMGVINNALLLASDFFLLTLLLCGLFIVDSGIATLTLFIFGCVSYILYRFQVVRTKNFNTEIRRLTVEIAERTYEVLSSYRELVVRNRRGYYSDEIGHLRYKSAIIQAKRSFIPQASKYVLEITLVLSALMIAALQFLINDAARSIGVLSIFLVASMRIAPAVLRIQQSAINVKGSIGTIEPTLEMFEQLKKTSENELVISKFQSVHSGFIPRVKIENLYFEYPSSQREILRDLSLEIYPGQIVALVGPSGSGKTTLLDLILGVLHPKSGTILLNNVTPDFAISNWPGAVSYVPQDVQIFNSTFRMNVSMGYPVTEATDERVNESLKLSNLDDYVNSLPLGIDTDVGERGNRLSGGQRQRLGIARAMFTNPLLLALDEATSALDGETEANIAKSISEMRGRVTVIMIAHRLSTVKSADRVLYLDSGRIIADGTFDEVRNLVPDFDKQAKLMET